MNISLTVGQKNAAAFVVTLNVFAMTSLTAASAANVKDHPQMDDMQKSPYVNAKMSNYFNLTAVGGRSGRPLHDGHLPLRRHFLKLLSDMFTRNVVQQLFSFRLP